MSTIVSDTDRPAPIEWKPQDRPCPVCESSDRAIIGRRGGEAHRSKIGIETTVVRCRNCDCLYTHPLLVPLSNPYSDHSADDYFALHDSERKKDSGARLARHAESILGRTGTMLEIGCGRGELLVGAQESGWKVDGIEMTPAFATRARASGIDVDEASAETSRFLDRRYDVILFAAVLEHLYEPAAVLRRARHALASDGLIFIDVPNEASLTMRVGNLYMRMRHRDWAVNLSPTFSPFHVVGFSPKTLTYLLRQTGYRVHSLETTRWTNALPEPKSLIERLEHRGLSAFSWLGHRLGMADGICCWAHAADELPERLSYQFNRLRRR